MRRLGYFPLLNTHLELLEVQLLCNGEPMQTVSAAVMEEFFASGKAEVFESLAFTIELTLLEADV